MIYVIQIVFPKELIWLYIMELTAIFTQKMGMCIKSYDEKCLHIMQMAVACDGSHCYELITIVNFHVEYCLICRLLFVGPNSSYLLIVIIRTTIVTKT